MLDAPIERGETVDALWRAIDGLSADLKMALLLRDVTGLSYTEIADSLEITLATVKWRIYKAREEVALTLAREGITFGSTGEAAGDYGSRASTAGASTSRRSGSPRRSAAPAARRAPDRG